MDNTQKQLKDVPCVVCNEYKAKRLCFACSKAVCLLHCKIYVDKLDIYRISQSPSTRTKIEIHEVCEACLIAATEEELPKTQ